MSNIGICPLTKQSQPSKSCASESVRNRLSHGLQLAIKTEPCPNRYDSYIVTNSGSTFAYSRCNMTSDMDLQKSFTRPTCWQHVTCFEVLFATPQFGHELVMDVSYRDTLLFVPHHPKTCFVKKILYILGKLDIARPIPCHQIVSKSAERNNVLGIKKAPCFSPSPVHLKGEFDGS
jgi:hypothetical protein